jgi:hypothetical protein
LAAFFASYTYVEKDVKTTFLQKKMLKNNVDEIDTGFIHPVELKSNGQTRKKNIFYACLSYPFGPDMSVKVKVYKNAKRRKKSYLFKISLDWTGKRNNLIF